LDIDGWRKEKESKLEKMAQRIADKVLETGTEEAIYNLKPSERRVIHAYFTQSSDITTESVGEGQARHITIKPRKS